MSVIIKSGTSGNLLVINSDGSVNVAVSGLSALDVTDRTARVLGHVVVDNFPTVGLGRNTVILYADRVAGRLIEDLETLTIVSGGVATAGSFYVVPTGKTFRMTSLVTQFHNVGGTGTAERVLTRVRSAVAVNATSPVIAMGAATSALANVDSGGQSSSSFPDGPEIVAGHQVGISQICTVSVAGVVSFLLAGFEY